jgi:tetratricopeptide (TPR) repeat protein
LTFNERGLAHKAKGDVDRTIADLNEAIRLNSGNAGIHYNRGHMLIEKGDLDRASADFDEPIRLGPNSIITTAKDDAITRLTIDRIKANYFGIRRPNEVPDQFCGRRVRLRALHTFHRDEPYMVVRLYLAWARSGQQADAMELQSNTSALKQTD